MKYIVNKPAKNKPADKMREFINRLFTPIKLPLELNEGNVHVIFNRCLAVSEGSWPSDEKTTYADPFPIVMGYPEEDNVVVLFDKAAIQADRKNILYLYGQLKNVHTGNRDFLFTDAPVTYRDVLWTKEVKTIMELLYLGSTTETSCIGSFRPETDVTWLELSKVKPTLSPKDPAFPEWWAQHKAEWED